MALMLSDRELAALAEYQSRLLARFPQRIRRIVLFGSKARGDAGPESDLDVLVVLGGGGKSQDGFYPLGLTDPAWREIVGMTFDLLMEYGVDISPTVISEDEFEEQPLLAQTIVREGIELWTQRQV
jgi:predicted nucleotidyltransferase